jgi:hypothetical protein
MKELCGEKELRGTIINETTGEIIDHLYEGDSILRDKSKDANEKYIRNFNKGESFLKIYDRVMPELCEKLSKAELSTAMMLLPYISYDDCILKHGDGSIIKLQDFPDLLGLSYDRVRKIIKSLTTLGVLGIFETGCKEKPKLMFKCYVFNPYIASKGTTINKSVAALFAETKWDK